MGTKRDDWDVRALWAGWAIIGAVGGVILILAGLFAPSDHAPGLGDYTPTPDPYRAPVYVTPVDLATPDPSPFAPIGTPRVAFYVPCHPWGMLGTTEYANRRIAGCIVDPCEFNQCEGFQ